jgi:hypothetical protein
MQIMYRDCPDNRRFRPKRWARCSRRGALMDATLENVAKTRRESTAEKKIAES